MRLRATMAPGLILTLVASLIGPAICLLSAIGHENDVSVESEYRIDRRECEASILTIDINQDATYFKLVSSNDNKILFSVGSKDVKLKDLHDISGFYMNLFFPVSEKDVLKVDEMDLLITKNRSSVSIVHVSSDGLHTLFYKEYPSIQNETEERTCTFLVGHKVVIAPNLDVNHRDGFNTTLSMWVLLLGSDAQAIDIIDKGANLSSVSDDGFPAFVYPIPARRPYILEYILNHRDVQVDRVVTFGVNLLQIAILVNSIDCMGVILDHGADITLRTDDDYGYTPLHLAVSSGFPSLVQELVRRGADLEAKDYENRTPLQLAVEEDQEEIARDLEKYASELKARSKNALVNKQQIKRQAYMSKIIKANLY